MNKLMTFAWEYTFIQPFVVQKPPFVRI